LVLSHTNTPDGLSHTGTRTDLVNALKLTEFAAGMDASLLALDMHNAALFFEARSLDFTQKARR